MDKTIDKAARMVQSAGALPPNGAHVGSPSEKDQEVIRQFINWLGDDPKREGLCETPRRFLEAWQEWVNGYNYEPSDVLKMFEDGAQDVDEMVFQASIPFFSHCEHHLAPFFGYAHIAYIPNGKIIGLSKMPRLLEVFARRLQVQERLTNQVANALMTHLEPRGVGVVLQARHLCLESRGVQKIGTITVTSALRGNFKEHPEVRAEFMALVNTAVLGLRAL